jgi:hypothetical protein
VSCHFISWRVLRLLLPAIPYLTPPPTILLFTPTPAQFLSLHPPHTTHSIQSTAIDWDHISKSTPPMKPSAKDINTATQSEIGSFQDEKISRKLILSEDDHKTYEKWEFLSKRSFQEEVVDFLTFEEKVVSFHLVVVVFSFFFVFFLFSFNFSASMYFLRTAASQYQMIKYLFRT